MKSRHNAVFVSSVLFTIALLSALPWFWSSAAASGFYGYFRPAPNGPIQQMEPGSRDRVIMAGQLGGVSLTVIAIALIVTWMGYAKRARWTWLVMFAVVWGWAYPALNIRLLIFNLSWKWLMGLFHDAVHDPNPHLPRVLLGTIFIFVLMLTALLLPIKSFLIRDKAAQAPAGR